MEKSSASTVSSAGQSREMAARLQRIQILIVVSSTSAADLIKRMFLQLGFTTILVALDTAEAVAAMREMRVDLIVTDCEIKSSPAAGELEQVSMPSYSVTTITGIYFVKRLRHSPASPNPFIPIIMLIRNASDQLVMHARDAGVNEVIIKPMSAPDFCSRIIAIIDRPRNFITAPTYKGPCRRRKNVLPEGMQERRKRDIVLLRYDQIQQKKLP